MVFEPIEKKQEGIAKTNGRSWQGRNRVPRTRNLLRRSLWSVTDGPVYKGEKEEFAWCGRLSVATVDPLVDPLHERFSFTVVGDPFNVTQRHNTRTSGNAVRNFFQKQKSSSRGHSLNSVSPGIRVSEFSTVVKVVQFY